MEPITSIRGFKDILPGESEKWQFVERKAREIFGAWGVREIRIPILEKTDLFRRGIGETTDIVEKEMYTFLDRGEESLTLRPEATASVIRSYIEHHFYETDPAAKLYTIGPMFRRERPQKGRYRQFHQINVEMLGYEDPRLDGELIGMLMAFLASLGIGDLDLEINSLGCADCRPLFREKVVRYLGDREDALCPDCRRRLQTNPLRIFDCKVEECREAVREAPVILDSVCDGCRAHFEKVKELLTAIGVPFKVNTRMVRGLDYYKRTAFEVIGHSLGAQNAVAGGGRYDGLVRDLGGPDIPGIGFAIGFERLVSMLPGKDEDYSPAPDLFVATLGREAEDAAFRLLDEFRKAGLRAETDYSGKSLKAQMKRANRSGASHVLIIGGDELAEGALVVRDMRNAVQEKMPIPDAIARIKEIFHVR